MPHVFKPLDKRFRVLLAAGLVLALATPASAQLQKPVKDAPLLFHNQTNMVLEIELESLDTINGTIPLKLTWKLNPGAINFLGDQKNNKIYARKFTYSVKTPGKTSRWIQTSAGPDGNGNFVAGFNQDNLRVHLGEKVVAQRPPLMPPPQAGPTPEQQASAVGKTIVALGLHAGAQSIAQKTLNDPNSTTAQRFFALGAIKLALEARNAAIRSALGDVFPRLTPQQSSDVQRLISDTVDGRLNFNEGQQAAKQRLVNSMRSTSPDLADAAVIADYIYAIYLAAKRR